MTHPYHLPSNIVGNMVYAKYSNYPMIAVDGYQNFIQKFIASSEQELFDLILDAKNNGKQGKKLTSEGLMYWCTEGLHGEDDSLYYIVQPNYPNCDVPYPHYSFAELHEQGGRIEYYAYIAFVPKIISLLP